MSRDARPAARSTISTAQVDLRQAPKGNRNDFFSGAASLAPHDVPPSLFRASALVSQIMGSRRHPTTTGTNRHRKLELSLAGTIAPSRYSQPGPAHTLHAHAHLIGCAAGLAIITRSPRAHTYFYVGPDMSNPHSRRRCVRLWRVPLFSIYLAPFSLAPFSLLSLSFLFWLTHSSAPQPHVSRGTA